MTNKIQTRGVLRPIEPEVYTPGEHDILVCCPFVESSFSIMHIVKGIGRTDVDADGAAGIGAGAEEGGASDLFPLALRDPLKVTDRSSRFQQFFFT